VDFCSFISDVVVFRIALPPPHEGCIFKLTLIALLGMRSERPRDQLSRSIIVVLLGGSKRSLLFLQLPCESGEVDSEECLFLLGKSGGLFVLGIVNALLDQSLGYETWSFKFLTSDPGLWRGSVALLLVVSNCLIRNMVLVSREILNILVAEIVNYVVSE